MKWRKFKAGALFTGTEVLPSDRVLITDEQGMIHSIVHADEAGDDVLVLDGLLSPGFVNTHCHLELSHMKGKVAPGTGLIDFLITVIRERTATPELVQEAMQQAATELYQSGTVAVGDICNTADSARLKEGSNIQWKSFIEVLGFNEGNAAERLQFARHVQDQFTTPATLSPHAPYSVSSALFHLINEAAAGEVVTVHNQETHAENELYQHKTGDFFRLYNNLSINAETFQPSGKSSLQTYLPWLNKAANLLLVHNTFIHEEDILFSKTQHPVSPDLFFCTCINANKYITSQVPPLDLFRKHACQLTLGTDSYASNNQLNILEEIRTIQQAFPHILLSEVLRWATHNGARALQLDHQLGTFEKGKQPGVVLISDVQDGRLTKESKAMRVI
ncbi:MAG: amidohydrolase family protein [Williamsia sp.]|nr:amidohydrolase family protein [Williamsia sp.]